MRGTLLHSIWTHDPADDYVPPRYRRACAYDAFLPDPIAGWTPELSPGVVATVAEAQHALAAIERDASPALAPLARLLLRTEAIASSKIEGMQVGARELARAEARHDLGARVGPKAREVIASIDAMQLALDDAARTSAVTLGGLRDIHRLLLADAPAWTTPGELRVHQNWIGGNNYNPCRADYVPPPPDRVEAMLADLLRAAAEDVVPGIVQCAIVHAQFETIHPFNDGNGRVGRALIHVLLRHRGLVSGFTPPISVVLAGDRDRYIELLVQFRAGDIEPWVEHFAVAVAQSVTIARRYTDDVSTLRTAWREQVSARAPTPRADAAVWLLLDRLPGHPVITAAVAAAITGRSKPAIGQAIGQLVDAGVLRPLSSGNRNRAWEVDGLLALIERLERD